MVAIENIDLIRSTPQNCGKHEDPDFFQAWMPEVKIRLQLQSEFNKERPLHGELQNASYHDSHGKGRNRLREKVHEQQHRQDHTDVKDNG